MIKNAFITGNSSGLGKGLTEVLLAQNYHVYGCSRRGCDLTGNISDIHCDLSQLNTITSCLDKLLKDISHLDIVMLNAGILGKIQDIHDTSLEALKAIMDINVWANKVIFDWLLDSKITIKQIILTSSGAAVLGNRGFNGYAISKAAMNMLAKLYAHEFPQTHIIALAPGLIDSKVMDALCEADSSKYPALKRIQAAKAGTTNALLSPLHAAERVFSVLEDLKNFTSGSFVDIREILVPEEYAELMGKK